MSIETNCFRIHGLDTLNTKYRLYQITGLHRDSPEYYANIQKIVRDLSYKMKAPVTTYDIKKEAFLVVPAGFGDPPTYVPLVRAVAKLIDTGEEIDLDFTSDRPELDSVRLRFLKFVFQSPLWQHPRLWQSGAGKPFFFKTPKKQFDVLDLYEGFAIRVAPHPEGGFGLIVDLRRKLISTLPLPELSQREKVNALKGRSCLYKMGYWWYEISLDGLADTRVGEPSIPLDGKAVSLIDYLKAKSPKPIPAAISNLRPDGAAIYYRTNGPEQRSAPAALCHLVVDTHSPKGAKHQRETVIDPQDRHRQINRLVNVFLKKVPVGDVILSVSEQAGRTRTKSFSPPDLRFGNGVILRLRTNKYNMCDAIADYGRKRLMFLKDEKAGFFEQNPLHRQYLILPKTVYNSYGSQFLKDLKMQVETLYPKGGIYNPEVIVYDDRNGGGDFVGQSRSIEKAVAAANISPGYALVMVHRYNRRPRSTDQLEAWITKEFPDRFRLTASVIHTDVPGKAYASEVRDGRKYYLVKSAERSRFSGYLRNVSLNKILLTNGKWPFILDTPMYADVVIGIDVKNNTAAFTLIADGGKIVRFSTSSSRQKEQLLKDQVRKFVIEIIHKESLHFNRPPKQIVIHRDGRAWPSEITGLNEACEHLATEGCLDQDWELTVVEISKSAPAPLRLFNVEESTNGHGCYVTNPIIGTWIITTFDEGYVCNTGQPFRIPGTSNPLHIRRGAGNMPIEHCLFDVFALSCLTWPQPEGVMRLPISIKLCDRNLFDEATEYDEDAIQFTSTNLEEEEQHE